MITPDNLHIMNKIAEIYYTLGKKEHLKLAKKYFSFVLMSQESNTRALWGLNYTLKAQPGLYPQAMANPHAVHNNQPGVGYYFGVPIGPQVKRNY